MKETWFISDTHFLHKAMLHLTDDEGKGQPIKFSNVEERDEHIIENWNKVVKDEDIVYHLGDVFMGSLSKYKLINSRLKGKKYLIVGNHDNVKQLVPLFNKVMMWAKIRDNVFTHVPIELQNTYDGIRFGYNIHGHIHTQDSPSSRHINLSVEKTNYSPVHIEDLFSNLGTKTLWNQ